MDSTVQVLSIGITYMGPTDHIVKDSALAILGWKGIRQHLDAAQIYWYIRQHYPADVGSRGFREGFYGSHEAAESILWLFEQVRQNVFRGRASSHDRLHAALSQPSFTLVSNNSGADDIAEDRRDLIEDLLAINLTIHG